MSDPRPLLLATRNAHKVRELAAQLGSAWAVRSLREVPELPDIEETGTTFSANAQLKALGISAHVNDLVLADDSGLEVDALNGEPGVYSARYAGVHGDDAGNNQKLLAELARVGAHTPAQRTARFHCVVVLAQNEKVLAEFSGVCEGHIASGLSEGAHGFGYDPLFVPEGYEVTFADLTLETKAALSHRGRAMRAMIEALSRI
jgi:XTP/dITP diphosphohydrolase